MFGGISRDISFSNSSFTQTSASGKSSTVLHKGGFRQVSSLLQYQPSPELVSQIPLETTPSIPLSPISNLPIKYPGITSLSFDGKYMASAYIDSSSNLPVLTIYQGVRNEYSIIYTNTPGDVIPSDIPFNGSNFCTCVISSDATVCVLGYCLDDQRRGAIWTYRYNGTFWVPSSSKILPIGSVGVEIEFGKCLALSTDKSTLVVGTPQEGFVGNINYIPGAVFVFKQTAAGVYSQFGQKLVGSGATDVAYQGISVCVSGTGSVIAFGAVYDDYNLFPLPIGCGFVFIENSRKTAYIQDGPKLKIPDSKTALNGLSCAINQNGTLVYLGCPLTISGASTSGAGVAVFDRLLTWRLHTYIPTPRSVVGLYSFFGQSISLSLDGNTLVVLAPLDRVSSSIVFTNGSIFIFSRSGGTSSPNVYTQNGGKIQNNKFRFDGESFESSTLCDISLSGDGKCIAYFNYFEKPPAPPEPTFLELSSVPVDQEPSVAVNSAQKILTKNNFFNLKNVMANEKKQPLKKNLPLNLLNPLTEPVAYDGDVIDIIISI